MIFKKHLGKGAVHESNAARCHNVWKDASGQVGLYSETNWTTGYENNTFASEGESSKWLTVGIQSNSIKANIIGKLEGVAGGHNKYFAGFK